MTKPPPASLIPVIPSAAVLVNAMLPLVVLVALKLPTVFAPFRVVPEVELEVNRPLVESVPIP